MLQEDINGFIDDIQLANDSAAIIRQAVADYLSVGSVEGLRDLIEVTITDTL